MSTVAHPHPRRHVVPKLTGGALLGVLALLLLIAVLTTTGICGGGGDDGPTPGGITDSKGKLDPKLARAINAVARRQRVDPYVIGALAMRETAGGTAVSCSISGACGAMQLMPAYWQSNHCDGNGDGREDINDVYDNVCASVRGLIKDKKTLFRRKMTRAEISAMAQSYCGSCTDANCGGGVDGGYCEGVVRNFQRLGGTFGSGRGKESLPDLDEPAELAPGSIAGAGTADASTCPAAGAGGPTPTGDGSWKMAPGTFGHGAAELSPLLATFLDRVAQYTSKPPILTTGSVGHAVRTTNGNISEHGAGRAGDFGSSANGFPISSVGPSSPTSFGDELAAAALIAAGLTPKVARANERRGGITDASTDFRGKRIRVQVIFRSASDSLGGNHTDHVHIGVRDDGPATGKPSSYVHSGP